MVELSAYCAHLLEDDYTVNLVSSNNWLVKSLVIKWKSFAITCRSVA